MENLRENVRDVYITSSVRQLLEISHRDAGKESGAKFLLEYLGLTREELAAFGDGDNDSGLLKYAGIGFAVANASPECRDAADEIVASNDENGVAQESIRFWRCERRGPESGCKQGGSLWRYMQWEISTVVHGQ